VRPFNGWSTLGSVLILAREEVVAALLGLMVEVSGFQPKFAEDGESAEDAVRENRFLAVLVDCDHPQFNQRLIASMKGAGVRPILFSPFRMHAEVSRLAEQHGAESFTLPAEPDVFLRILRG
jgi:DNA-binding response OmpR family regulator